MAEVPGTEGYERHVPEFIRLSQALSFETVCADFLGHLPEPPGRILDAGTGAGQNAAALALMGHSVVAVEPLSAFLEAARTTYAALDIRWIRDSLPLLERLPAQSGPFDFILVDGVWHHLTEEERSRTLARFSVLLREGGRCALSLRNGPPGMGTRVYPTRVRDTVQDAEQTGFVCTYVNENQPSLLPGKASVSWARLVLEKVR